MPRSNNLDNLAPDDPIPSPDSSASEKKEEILLSPSQQSQPAPEIAPESAPQPEPQKKTAPSSSASSPFRQKIYDILGRTKSPFSSFLVRPKVFTFQERDDEEEIILALRQHWITNIPWIFITILMILFPLLFNYVPFLQFFAPNYQFIATLFWYLVTFAFAFEKFLSWYFNVYIITDERVIDIDFTNLINKKFTEASIKMIQDVTSHVIGVPGTLFNYGNVLIQTASEIPEIVFERVPNPEKIIKVLQQLRQEEEQEAIEGRVR